MNPDDPFDADEMQDIYRNHDADCIYGAVEEAQTELDDAAHAIAVLTEKLRELIPPAAVVNLVSSVALSAALNGAYGGGLDG